MAGETWRFPSGMADVTFLRSWLVYDSKLASIRHSGKFNWNFAFGSLLAVGISAGFWVALGVSITKVLR
jgi:hypothetical protein